MDLFIGHLCRYRNDLRGGSFGGADLRYESPDGDFDAVLSLRSDDRRDVMVHWKNFAKALRSYDERRAQKSSPVKEPRESWSLANVKLSENIVGKVLRSCDERREQKSSPVKEPREEWSLVNVELSGELRSLLAPALVGRRSLGNLTLDRNEFGRDGVLLTCNILEGAPLLNALAFRNNPVENLDDMATFCEAVREHPSLEILSLENIGLGDDEDKLGLILNASKNLNFLFLSYNGMGSRGSAALISQFLGGVENRTKNVCLCGNNFADDTADLLSSALRRNNNLCVVKLSGNRFTQFGKRILHDALFDTSSLKAAVESNHSTIVWVDESEILDQSRTINSRGTPEQNLHRKVFATFYAATNGGQLSKLLEDMPLGLMPHVLDYLQDYYLLDIPRGIRKHAMETLQDYTNDDYEEVYARQDIFSIVFEVLRSWNLPLLYTNL